MSDRLSELQRQRALIQGHLTWLDQEIARAAGASITPTPTATASSALIKDAVALPAIQVSAPDVRDADALIAQYETNPKNLTQSTRKGCFMIFGLALLLLGIVICGLLLYTRSRHAHDLPPVPKSAPTSPANR